LVGFWKYANIDYGTGYFFLGATLPRIRFGYILSEGLSLSFFWGFEWPYLVELFLDSPLLDSLPF
jgi:hypothetical protein